MSAFPACAYHAGSRSHAECMRALLVSCSRLSSVLCAFTRVRTAGRPQPRRPELDGHDGGQPGDEAKQSHACCPSTVMDCLTVRLSRRTMLTVFNPMPLHIPFFFPTLSAWMRHPVPHRLPQPILTWGDGTNEMGTIPGIPGCEQGPPCDCDCDSPFNQYSPAHKPPSLLLRNAASISRLPCCLSASHHQERPIMCQCML